MIPLQQLTHRQIKIFLISNISNVQVHVFPSKRTKKPLFPAKKNVDPGFWTSSLAPAKKKRDTTIFFASMTAAFNLYILRFISLQSNVLFEPTGYVTILITEQHLWYRFFTLCLLLRFGLYVSTHLAKKYIQTLTHWSEIKRKILGYLLTACNAFFVFPFQIAWVSVLFYYWRGDKIIRDHWFIGTCRRLPSEEESVYFEYLESIWQDTSHYAYLDFLVTSI